MGKKRIHDSKVFEYISYYGSMPLVFLLRLLPHRLILGMAGLLGILSYYVFPFRKKVVLDNLKQAFGTDKTPAEIRRITRACYYNFSVMFAEFIRMPVISPIQLQSLVTEVEGWQYYEELAKEKGGYLVITAHLGNWELLASYFSSLGIPFSVIARPMHNSMWDAEINRTRVKNGLSVLSTREPVKHILSHIRQGRPVVFLVDQDARRNGIFVNFFNKPASTFAGVGVLTLRFGLPILPFFTVRTSLTHHKGIFKPPIYPQEYVNDTRPRDEVVHDVVQRVTDLVESVVREYPDQYFWFHRRWKTRPKKKKVCHRAPSSGNPEQGTSNQHNLTAKE